MKTAGLVLLTALSAFAAISGVVFDFRATHIYNPGRPTPSFTATRPPPTARRRGRTRP
jgi:hypothetical protein